MVRRLLSASPSQDGEHRSALHRRRAFDHADVGDARGNARDLGSGDLGMRGFATAEPHLDFHLVAVLQKTASGSDAYLQVMLVSPGPQAHLLDLRDMLILLCIASALVLLEAKLANVANSADGRTGTRGDLDQVEPCVFRALQSFLNRHHSDLLAVVIDNANFGSANLPVGT